VSELTNSLCRGLRMAFRFCAAACLASGINAAGADETPARSYKNELTLLPNPRPILDDFPDFVQKVEESRRFEAPRLVDDPAADLSVRSWRFSYNARGIIEIPNRLKAVKTAVIVVHPWGVDDGQGWRTPEPAGVAFAGTIEKNQLMLRHAKIVVNPFLKSLRGRAGLVMYSLPGKEDPIRKKLYRSFRSRPTLSVRKEGERELAEKLKDFSYQGAPIPQEIKISSGRPAVDYFRQFPGVDSGARYDHEGFWELPIPVMKPLEVDPADVIIYDGDGYPALRDFLTEHGIEHVLLCGYHADMCVCSTTAGYENLRRDFNVFLVADAVQSTLPANRDSRYATNQSISYASLNLLITQVSWVKTLPAAQGSQ
jgi:Isochorismatase family